MLSFTNVTTTGIACEGAEARGSGISEELEIVEIATEFNATGVSL